MISDEKLITIIEEVVGNNKTYFTQVYNIVKKIIDLPTKKITTIAKLINYNPKENFIDPLTQGMISRYVEEICQKLNIELESTKDKIGGLAYYNEFKKIDYNK